jgi:hypothetical protein
MRQSHNIFGKGPEDPIFLSNVFQDFKLAKLSCREKFIFRTRTRASYLYDLEQDPGETVNRIDRLDGAEIEQRQRELVQWYFAQIDYLEQEFPP